MEYAIGDVTHLCKVYEGLLAALEERGRAAWVEEEIQALVDPDKYSVDPERAYKRIKIRRPSPKNLVVLRALAKWREETAMQRDLPRNWVVRDDAPAEIAQHGTPSYLAKRAACPGDAQRRAVERPVPLQG